MFEEFKKSFKSFHKPEVICFTAMLTAISVVVQSFTFTISSLLQFSFTFLPVAISGVLFGSFPAMVVAASSDVISFLIRPRGDFFPGFTLNAAIMGLIYGIFFYSYCQCKSHKRKIFKIIFAEITINIVNGLAFTTLWLHILYKTPIMAILGTRLIKFLFTVPFNIIVLVLFFGVLENTIFKKIKKKY